MPPIEELEVIKKRKALEIPLEPEPDAFAALTPRGSSPVNKKGRTHGEGELRVTKKASSNCYLSSNIRLFFLYGRHTHR